MDGHGRTSSIHDKYETQNKISMISNKNPNICFYVLHWGRL